MTEPDDAPQNPSLEEDAEDVRTCDRCGDGVQTLSSRDLCDGCEEEQEAKDLAAATERQDVEDAESGTVIDGQGPGCQHPAPARLRDPEDGTQVCTLCSEVISAPTGEEEAAAREITAAPPESGQGVLRHIPWGQGARPYTPEDVEHEILDYIARLNSGARFQAGKEQELREAEVRFEIAHARKLLEAPGRSEKMRLAWALLEVQEQWTEVQILRQVVRTTREGMHTLRQQLTGLQSVSRSVGVTGGTGPGPRGSAFQ